MVFLWISFNVNAQTQIGQDIQGDQSGDRSGWSVSLSGNGNILAVGAPENDTNGTSSGQVKVYQNQNGSWIQLGNTINGEGTGDDAGWSVSLSQDGTIMAIGAPLNDGPMGTNTGHVRVFEYSDIDGVWMQIGVDIDITGAPSFDRSGWSVSLNSDGNRIAVGATNSNANGVLSGQVRIFENQNDNWVQIGNSINGESSSDQSGRAVSLNSDGTIVAIGAPNNENNGFDSGYVRVFQLQGNSWVQLGNDINGIAVSDEFGSSVSLNSDGTILAAGAPFNDGNGGSSGHVRVFQLQNSSWVQLGSDIEGENSSDEFGTSVSLSDNGQILAVGAPFNDGSDVNSGHTRIFRYVSNNWLQVGNDIDDGTEANSQSGNSVSLSSDGSVAAIGAPFNDNASGTDAGETKVFDLSTVLSTNSVSDNLGITLYPNPAHSEFMVKIPNNENLYGIEIYNMLGELVTQSNRTNMNTQGLSSGVYVVKISSSLGEQRIRLVIE